MRYHAKCVAVLLSLVLVGVVIESARGGAPRTAMYERLSKKAVERLQFRRNASRADANCLQRIADGLFGWEGTFLAAGFPAETLLWDQVLDKFVADLGAIAEFEPLAKTPESRIVHVTYGADCELPAETILQVRDSPSTRAAIAPLWHFPNDQWICQVDLGLARTRAEVYVTVRVREKATKRVGNLLVFVSLALEEPTPGDFHWRELARTQDFHATETPTPKDPTAADDAGGGQPGRQGKRTNL